MKLFYFVSITIFVSIDVCRSQQANLNGFPQPKAIRDNSGYYRQETFYPGLSSGNAIVQQTQQPITIQKPLVLPTTTPAPAKLLPFADTLVTRTAQNQQKFVANPSTLRPATTTEPETDEELEEQAKSAYYKFGTSVHDTINDHEQSRQETREGLALTGMYSYSDGFFRRTVHYKADENGYRVTKEEIQQIGDGNGPKFNPKGQAEVKSTLSGDYSINIDDFKLNKKQEDQIEKKHE